MGLEKEVLYNVNEQISYAIAPLKWQCHVTRL